MCDPHGLADSTQNFLFLHNNITIRITGVQQLLTKAVYVITIVITMETTIIKIGNSLGSRYSRAYLEKLGVREGDRVEVVIRKKTPDSRKAIQALREIAATNSLLSKVDVEKWQMQRREQARERDQEFRDILGH